MTVQYWNLWYFLQRVQSQWVKINPWLWPTVPLRPQCQQCRVSMCCNQGLYSDNKINTKSEQFKGRCTYYVIKFCPICDPPPFRLEWNAHPIPAGVELSHSIPAGMEWALHSGRNGMNTPFLQEWNDSIPSLQEWNEHSIPAGMECHSTPNLKKYASWNV